MRINGVGDLTATAVIDNIGDANNFKNGRHYASYLGLVPRQNSSGVKSNLLGIIKRGDIYLRTLLVHGARAAGYHCKDKIDKTSLWLHKKFL